MATPIAQGIRPVLWHIPVSHYSEKIRWALDYKSLDCDRREPPAGLHMLIAYARTRGRHHTFPIMRFDQATLGDSSSILEAMELYCPDPRLYPADPDARLLALELEDWFDEYLGPPLRRLVWHEVTRDRRSLAAIAAQTAPPGIRRLRGVRSATARSFVNMRYRAGGKEGAKDARAAVVSALDYLEQELGDSEYLVGDEFSVADLTAAALFYPLVLPPEGPRVIQTPPEGIDRFRESLKDRPGYRWVEEMFRRHRHQRITGARAADKPG